MSTFTDRLSWQPHIDSICNKANRLLGFLYRHCPNKLKECAYKQMIVPILEYCSPIWTQHRSIHKIELIALPETAVTLCYSPLQYTGNTVH